MSTENSPLRIARRARVLVALIAAALPVTASVRGHDQPPANPARVSYTKVLKGSTPEFLSITVSTSGEASYDGRKLDESPAPRSFQLTAATTRRIFQLAVALSYFDSVDLESHRKVANLGLKTFVYEGDGKKNRAEFNYTMRRDAQELADVFEKIGSVAQHIAALEYSIKYDHLSLPKQLQQIQIDLQKHALAEPELMAPTLEKIARNPRFLHLAQSRAQDILQRLQNDSN